eukprot:jgi/Chrpa1/21784/Chrysochromulina_OHIO_Genome00023888-RA
MLEPSAGVAPLRLSSKPDSMLIFGRDIDPQAKTAIGVRSIQISRKQGQLRRLADGTVECRQVGTGLMRCNGGYFECGEVRQLTVGDVLELLEINACPDGKGKVRKVVASWSVVKPPTETPPAELPAAAPRVTLEATAASAQPPPSPQLPSKRDHRDRPPPHSAPMAKRVRLGPLPPAADAQLWVELKDAALNDLNKSKTELANTQAIMQRQNSIILRQTSTIAAFKDMMKSSRGALALSSLAKLVHTVTPEVFATIVRVVATRLGT